MNTLALKDLLYRMADDALIMGHRNSEWTGIGPILEEDIAFSSMAQDEMGHALAYYSLLHELGEPEPDQIAFNRPAQKFRCCQLVEFPIGDYAFSLVRHFLYDYAVKIRLEDLRESSYQPLAELAAKLLRENKYHTLHARTWITQLAAGNSDARQRLQAAVHLAYPMAFSLFEPNQFTAQLDEDGVMSDEITLLYKWSAEVVPILENAGLEVKDEYDEVLDYFGGRHGEHSEHLQPLLKEMNEVFALDPTAKW